MRNSRFTLLYFLFLISVSCFFSCNTDKEEKNWYKGNLHTHSYWSDGDEFPEMIMEWYKTNDYQFIALSDHNILAEGEKWIELRDEEIYHKDFQKYLEKYGSDWVVYKEDSGKVQVQLKTYEEYRPLFEEKEHFLIIQSEEISDHFDNKPIHLNATNIQNYIEPQGGNSVAQVLQNNINAVLEQREKTGLPMMVHVNHPNFAYAVSLEDMIQLKGERFFEVFNGHPQVHNFGDSVHISTEEMWDLINIAYLKNNQPLIYGLATDDSHHYHRFESKWSNSGRGWVMVHAESLKTGSLITAMENGRFYASTGVSLETVSFEDNILEVVVKPEPGVDYEISFIGCNKGEKQTGVLKQIKGDRASYIIDDTMQFVRAKVTSDKPHGNPIEIAHFEMAWVQPVTFVE